MDSRAVICPKAIVA